MPLRAAGGLLAVAGSGILLYMGAHHLVKRGMSGPSITLWTVLLLSLIHIFRRIFSHGPGYAAQAGGCSFGGSPSPRNGCLACLLYTSRAEAAQAAQGHIVHHLAGHLVGNRLFCGICAICRRGRDRVHKLTRHLPYRRLSLIHI